jgi:hypothetical protein
MNEHSATHRFSAVRNKVMAYAALTHHTACLAECRNGFPALFLDKRAHWAYLHRIASHRIASHRIASHRIASHRIASHRIAAPVTGDRCPKGSYAQRQPKGCLWFI